MEVVNEEVDKYDYTTCPYNNAHRVHKIHEFKNHIYRCKDANLPRITPRIRRCPFNPYHIFIDDNKLAYHIPRCIDHEARKVIVFRHTCDKNPNHECMDLKAHKTTCPNQESPWVPPELPAMSVKPRTTIKVPKKKAKIAPENKISIALGDLAFSVLFNKAKEDKVPLSIILNCLTNANYRIWPGLRSIENSKSYNQYLVGYLLPDPIHEVCFEEFIGKLKQKNTQIAASFQDCANIDRIYLIVHKSEPSGFGARLNSYNLGLFSIPYSSLTGYTSFYEEFAELCDQETSQISENAQNSKVINQEKTCLTESNMKLNEITERYTSKKTINNQELDNRFSQTNDYMEELVNEYSSIIEFEEDKCIKMNKIVKGLKHKYEKEEKIIDTKYYKEIENRDQELKEENENFKTYSQILRDKDRKIKQISEIDEDVNSKKLALEAVLQEKTATELCIMCSQKKNTVMVPCGHISYCNTCLAICFVNIGERVPPNNQLSICPECTSTVHKYHKCFPY